MCGFVNRKENAQSYQEFMEPLGWGELVPSVRPADGSAQQFYPAFGADPNRQIKGLIISENHQAKAVDATWWFDCKESNGNLVVGKRTTFNARNLESPFWKDALRHRRAIVIADGIGESKKIGTKKHQYLMRSKTPFLLGALYRHYSNGQYSCAVITRDSHPKFEPYHDKAFPLFLPPDKDFLSAWLNEDISEAKEIDQLLTAPKLFPTLAVQEVKTYKSGEGISEKMILESDDFI